MASRENQTSLLTLVTVAVMLAVFAGLVWFVVEQQRAIPTRDDQQREERLKNLAALNADNQKILTTYRWVDKDKGVVGIPIERAMDLEVKDLSTNHPHPAGPIVLPAAQPSATQQPSPNANPPPAATPANNPATPANNPATPVNSPAPTPSPVPSATPMSNAAASPESANSPSATPAASPAANPLPAATPEVTPAPSPASDAPTPEASIVPSAPAGQTDSTPSPQP
jgi:hypothetical protein